MIDAQFLPITDPILGPYEKNYVRVCITGKKLPPNYVPRKINTLNDLKYSFLISAGLPRISSTPLSVGSAYNRFPYINQGSLATQAI
jgi:hypothetical protein